MLVQPGRGRGAEGVGPGLPPTPASPTDNQKPGPYPESLTSELD